VGGGNGWGDLEKGVQQTIKRLREKRRGVKSCLENSVGHDNFYWLTRRREARKKQKENCEERLGRVSRRHKTGDIGMEN